MSTINTAELRAVLEEIEAHPGRWDQFQWARRTPLCGADYCFAGHVVARSSEHEIIWVADGTAECRDRQGRRESIEEVARRILGLDPLQASDLFRATNTRTTLRRIVESLCAQAEILERMRVEAAIIDEVEL